MKITYHRKHRAGAPTDQIPQEIKRQCMSYSRGEYTPLSEGGHALLLQTVACETEPVYLYEYRLHNPSKTEIATRITMQDNRMLLAILLKGKISAEAHPFNSIQVEGAQYFPILAPKDQPYPVVFEGEEVHVVLLSISAEVLEDVITKHASFAYLKKCTQRNGHHVVAFPDVPLPSGISKIVQQFLDPAAPPVLNLKTHCKNLIYQVLQAYLRDISKNNKRIKIRMEEILFFSEITHYISEKIAKKRSQELSLVHLCTKFICTDKQLQALFKKRAGTTVMAFVRLDRLVKAKYLLIMEPLRSQAEVGEACGYKKEETFRRAFSKQWGRCPKKFRKEESGFS